MRKKESHRADLIHIETKSLELFRVLFPRLGRVIGNKNQSLPLKEHRKTHANRESEELARTRLKQTIRRHITTRNNPIQATNLGAKHVERLRYSIYQFVSFPDDA